MRQKAAKLINKHAQVSGVALKKLKRYWNQTPRPLRRVTEIIFAIEDFKFKKQTQQENQND